MPEMLASDYVAYYSDYTLLQAEVRSSRHKRDKLYVTSVTCGVFCLSSPLTSR
jgi:hypothetical protein